MENLSERIYTAILKHKSIFLIGPTNSGKTLYTKHELIPFLQKKGLKVVYFEDCDHILDVHKDSIVIVDEVETLLDQNYLENKNKSGKPYYSLSYLKKVKNWHDKLGIISQPSIFIITRNNKGNIDYLVKNIKTTDWKTAVECISFT